MSDSVDVQSVFRRDSHQLVAPLVLAVLVVAQLITTFRCSCQSGHRPFTGIGIAFAEMCWLRAWTLDED